MPAAYELKSNFASPQMCCGDQSGSWKTVEKETMVLGSIYGKQNLAAEKKCGRSDHVY
jgi:hypothetical protein